MACQEIAGLGWRVSPTGTVWGNLQALGDLFYFLRKILTGTKTVFGIGLSQ